jgi:hypothetical protein
VDLQAGERAIAWAPGPRTREGDPTYIVASDRALHVGPWAQPSRIPWDLVDKATWDEPVLEMTVRARPGAPARPVRLRLEEPGDLPVVVRERVVASVVVQQHVALRGDKGARIVARQGSDDGVVRWSVVFDPGLDPRDPALRAEADEALARLRDHVTM